MLKKHTISFRNAFNGLIWVIKTQPNYRVHLALSTLAVCAGIYYQIDNNQWLIIGLLIVVGLVIETINTAIEATTDAITDRWREEIKIAKDASAAAMLIFAVGAVIISGAIFIPKILY